jgi:MFS family permease
VIETLSAGYAAVNRQLWVLLVPILIDVLLWLGPHVSYSPLVEPAVTHATEWARQVASAPRRGQPRNPELASELEAVRVWTVSYTSDTNALSLLARGPLVVPSLVAAIGGVGGLAFVNGWPEGVLLLFGLFALSLLLGGCFYGGLAGASVGRAADPLGVGRRAPRRALRVVGLLAATLGVGLLLGLPVLVLIGFTVLVARGLALLGIVLVLAALLLVEIHLFFAVDAIFVSDVGPLAAVQRSVGLVRRHLWPTLGLIFLTWLILAGMGRAFELLATALRPPFGVALAILGNAYIASGLIAAGMIFYSERVEAHAQPSAARAQA